MLKTLLGRKTAVTEPVNKELVQRIIFGLRHAPVSSALTTRWELRQQYEPEYGEEAVRLAIDEAVRVRELLEENGNICFNPHND